MTRTKEELERLVEEFGKAAMDWGWQQDQGYNADDIEASRTNCVKARDRLLTALMQEPRP